MEQLMDMLLSHLPAILQSIAWSLVLWVWWSMKKVFVRHEDLDSYKKTVHIRLVEIESHQQDRAVAHQQVQQRLDQLPTGKDMQALALALKDLEGDIKSMNHKVDGLSHATHRLEKAVDLFTEAHMGGGR